MSGTSPQKTLNQISSIAQRLRAVIQLNKDHALSQDSESGKLPRHYNQAEAIKATGAHAKNIGPLCAQLGIDTQDGNRWRITLKDVQALRESLGYLPFVREKNQKLQIIAVSSLKGGATKTTVSTTLAVGLATECKTRYRIGFMDLDPQSTATNRIKPNTDETIISAGDLLSGQVQLDEGETFEDACKASFYPTNIPNLRILPAKESDREYEVLAEERKASGGYIAYKDLQRIIDAVADDFDIIIIDTAPQFSTATLAAHYCANNLIIPIRPSEDDRDASSKYLDFLERMYHLIAGMGHGGWDNLSILLSAVRSTSNAHKQMVNEIRSAIGQDCYAVEIPESEAVLTCAKQYCTVFDMSASEYVNLGSRNTIKTAQTEFGHLVEEVEAQIKRSWGIK